jgi:hypothetical protein
MIKEQLGKNIFCILEEEKNNIKLFQIKHRTKIKIWFLIENNVITYTKIRKKMYVQYLVAWIKFHPEIKVNHLGKIILTNEQLDLLENQLQPKILLFHAFKNKNSKILQKLSESKIDNIDEIILDCCDCSHLHLNKFIKNKKHLYESIFVRAIFNKNKDLIKNLLKKIKNIYFYIELTNNLEFIEIFNILVEEHVKRNNLNKS